MLMPAGDLRDYNNKDLAILLSYQPKINDGKFCEVPTWLIEEAIRRLRSWPIAPSYKTDYKLEEN